MQGRPVSWKLIAQVWQEAMTSKQVKLILAMGLLVGCTSDPRAHAPPLNNPYGQRTVWAVAPLRNESGSAYADGARLADHLARQLEHAGDLDVMPVNRVLAAMTALKMPEVASPAQAVQLQRTLGAAGLVVGTVTAYDPYDPPKVGLQLELFAAALDPAASSVDVRELVRSPAFTPAPARAAQARPVSAVSAVIDASDPAMQEPMRAYAAGRSPQDRRPSAIQSFAASHGLGGDPDHAWRRYRISMDLFVEFASYVMSRRLLEAETQRLSPPAQATGAPPDHLRR